jgi:hypothetical protein
MGHGPGRIALAPGHLPGLHPGFASEASRRAPCLLVPQRLYRRDGVCSNLLDLAPGNPTRSGSSAAETRSRCVWRVHPHRPGLTLWRLFENAHNARSIVLISCRVDQASRRVNSVWAHQKSKV